MDKEKDSPLGVLGCLVLLIILAASFYLSILILRHFWAVVFLAVPILAFLYARNYLELRKRIRGWSGVAFLLLALLLVGGSAVWMIYDIKPGKKVEIGGELAESHAMGQGGIEEADISQLELIPGGEEALVSRVIDGDTIEVVFSDGRVERVRYIGVNALELDQAFGMEARDYNQGLVEGRKVRLVRDISDRDRYQRLLRYVFLGPLFVNAALVREGYASCSTYPPDVSYSYYFLQLEREARAEGRGLWSSQR